MCAGGQRWEGDWPPSAGNRDERVAGRPRTQHGSALKVVVFPTEAPSEGLAEGEERKEVSLGQSSAKSFHQGGGKHSGTFFSCGNEFLSPPVYLSSCAHCYLVRMSLLNKKRQGSWLWAVSSMKHVEHTQTPFWRHWNHSCLGKQTPPRGLVPTCVGKREDCVHSCYSKSGGWQGLKLPSLVNHMICGQWPREKGFQSQLGIWDGFTARLEKWRLPTPVFWPGEFHGLVHGVAKSRTGLSDFHLLNLLTAR